MPTDNLQMIFDELSRLVRACGRGLRIADGPLEGSTAKEQKAQLHVVGEKIVAIGNRKPQPTYVMGVVQQKHFVGLYSMPLYSHPQEIVIADDDVAKMRKGKSCINVAILTPAIRKELERIMKDGVRVYKREGWI